MLSSRNLSRCAAVALFTSVLAQTGRAGGAAFDLAGPVLEATVTRAGTTLPASQVPNLAAGDRIWIRANLPASQSAHYLLVATFLSGSTNPPPDSWFFDCKAWTPKCRADGLTVTVPVDAQQMVVFLAPETGGDYKTLRSAVRGRPGAFVRTSQDLNQAELDRSRLDRYLEAVRALNDADPAKLAAVAPLLARSLAIKVDEKCLDRIPALQAPCLMAGQESLDLERRAQHLDRGGIDLGPRGRSRDAGELHAAARVRILQPLHRLGSRHREDPRLVSHGAIPVHPGARDAQGQRFAIDAERRSVVPRSEVGPGGRAARRRAGAAAAAARGRSQGDLLRAQDSSGAAGRGRTARLLDGVCARHDLELGGSRQVPGAACGRRRRAGRIRGRYVRLERREPRR